jgi:hypothetical protein
MTEEQKISANSDELFMNIRPELSVRIYSESLDDGQKAIMDKIKEFTPNVRVKLAGYHNGDFLKVLVFYNSVDEYELTVDKLSGLIPEVIKPNLYINLTYYTIDMSRNEMIKRATIYNGAEWRNEMRTFNLYWNSDIENVKKHNQENTEAVRLSDFMRQ